MRASDEAAYAELLARLRAEYPPVLPVRVTKQRRVIVDGEAVLGVTWLGSGRFEIRVDGSRPWNVVRDTLLHEWAHALSWQEGETVCCHDPEWGIAYARLYQEIVDV